MMQNQLQGQREGEKEQGNLVYDAKPTTRTEEEKRSNRIKHMVQSLPQGLRGRKGARESSIRCRADTRTEREERSKGIKCMIQRRLQGLRWRKGARGSRV